MSRPIAAVGFLLAACISSNPPAAPVRWFDPTPDAWPAPAAPDRALPSATVTASPGVRQEFVLRMAPRELVIDAQHQWREPPERLLAAVLEGALSGPGSANSPGERIHVRMLRFEFDLTGTLPQAVVELQPLLPHGLQRCLGKADAGSRDPGDLAAAMAAAVAQAVAQLQAALMAR